MFMVVTIQIMFPEAAHYKTMLPGGPLLARLAWRPQLQLRRVLVQCATLPAQRSESSDQRRGQGRRFAPLMGATGAGGGRVWRTGRRLSRTMRRKSRCRR